MAERCGLNQGQRKGRPSAYPSQNIDHLETSCDCSYPGEGCKHIVAVLLDVMNVIKQWKKLAESASGHIEEPSDEFLTPDEIRELALDDRRSRAGTETFEINGGQMIKGAHLVETKNGRQYTVTLHDPEGRAGQGK
jgi:hypothetical protein